MNAMILAAGRGTRLGSLGETVPKVLVEVGGEPLLARQLRYLRENGVERIVINAHHLADQIEGFVASQPDREDIVVIVERELLGTAGGVVNALPRLGDEGFVVLYGDVIIEESLVAVCETHRQLRAAATLTVYASDRVEGKGTVQATAEGLVEAFAEKASAAATGQALINAGLYVVEPDLLAGLPAGAPLDFGHDVLPQALARRRRIGVHLLAEPVIDMGTPEMLHVARAALAAQRLQIRLGGGV